MACLSKKNKSSVFNLYIMKFVVFGKDIRQLFNLRFQQRIEIKENICTLENLGIQNSNLVVLYYPFHKQKVTLLRSKNRRFGGKTTCCGKWQTSHEHSVVKWLKWMERLFFTSASYLQPAPERADRARLITLISALAGMPVGLSINYPWLAVFASCLPSLRSLSMPMMRLSVLVGNQKKL